MKLLMAAIAAVTVMNILEINSNEFLKEHDANAAGVGRVNTEIEITGLVEGLAEANVFLSADRHETPIYCMPPGVMTGPQLIEILRQGINENPELGKIAPQLAVFEVMRKKFPCPIADK